ncbi:MAG: hypothetical protein ACD_47C00254G0001 [uncultured bacterium]|nr:MAG: hypothetical protein ACD_47C00254G0001 [uncultured bacterium]
MPSRSGGIIEVMKLVELPFKLYMAWVHNSGRTIIARGIKTPAAPRYKMNKITVIIAIVAGVNSF